MKKNLVAPFIFVAAAMLSACANIGRPDGGPFDETPPVMLRSAPEQGGLNVKRHKITIEFDEYIKLENANEKVVISPPQTRQPALTTVGKKISVNLEDTLIKDMTYTIDFGDAITDNNEGNPLENFTFTFSTGETIDSLEVAGTVLNAADLEPKKGMLVGLYSNLEDSAFTKTKMERIGRTDSRGMFRIKGVKPGKYRVYALLDNDQNYMFSQKSEEIAFLDSIIVPDAFMDFRNDTLWVDSLTIDTIMTKSYTHFIPDDVILKVFQEDYKNQALLKNDRATKEKFTLFFNTKADTLPTLRGLNFDEKDAFIIEPSMKNDTITYWIKDSTIYNTDTLKMSVTYLTKDSTMTLVPRTDTVNVVTKKIFTKEKKKKKDDEEIFVPSLSVKFPGLSNVWDGYKDIVFETEHPVEEIEKDVFTLKMKKDTILTDVPFNLEKVEGKPRNYKIIANWEAGENYVLTADSASIRSIYGLTINKIAQNFKIRPIEEYGMIVLYIKGLDGKKAFAELLNASDKPLRKAEVVDNTAEFNFLPAGKYYIRLCIDNNGDGEWTTGEFEKKLHAEEVFYYNGMIDLKAQWTIEQDWDIYAIPADKQKPNEIKKQKPEEKKKQTRTRTYKQ